MSAPAPHYTPIEVCDMHMRALETFRVEQQRQGDVLNQIAIQLAQGDERIEEQRTRTTALEGAVYGNGSPGLKTKVERHSVYWRIAVWCSGLVVAGAMALAIDKGFHLLWP